MSENITDADFLLEQFKYRSKTRTVRQFVEGIPSTDGTQMHGCTNMPASRIRRILGELYGLGLVKVIEVVDGEEVWTSTTTKDRLAL